MQLKKLMENWRKVIKEEEWDPTEIVGALAEDFGVDPYDAPEWMVAVASQRPFLVVYRVFSEKRDLFGENSALGEIYENNKKKHSQIPVKIKEFIDLAASELGVKLEYKVANIGVTDWVDFEGSKNARSWLGKFKKEDYWDDQISALIIPYRAEILERLRTEYSLAFDILEEEGLDSLTFEMGIRDKYARFQNVQGTLGYHSIKQRSRELAKIYEKILLNIHEHRDI